jgi:hypothetical protein
MPNLTLSEQLAVAHSIIIYLALVSLTSAITVSVWLTIICIRHVLAPLTQRLCVTASDVGKRILSIAGYVIVSVVVLSVLGFVIYMWLRGRLIDFADMLMFYTLEVLRKRQD